MDGAKSASDSSVSVA